MNKKIFKDVFYDLNDIINSGFFIKVSKCLYEPQNIQTIRFVLMEKILYREQRNELYEIDEICCDSIEKK
jgi:hypothetical protein